MLTEIGRPSKLHCTFHFSNPCKYMPMNNDWQLIHNYLSLQNHAGRIVTTRWVVGLVDLQYRPPRPIFFVVRNRNQQTLHAIITRHVSPGKIIVSLLQIIRQILEEKLGIFLFCTQFNFLITEILMTDGYPPPKFANVNVAIIGHNFTQNSD